MRKYIVVFNIEHNYGFIKYNDPSLGLYHIYIHIQNKKIKRFVEKDKVFQIKHMKVKILQMNK